MKIHFSKIDILRMICDKYQFKYDEVKDETRVIDIVLKNDILITWEGNGFEYEDKN